MNFKLQEVIKEGRQIANVKAEETARQTEELARKQQERRDLMYQNAVMQVTQNDGALIYDAIKNAVATGASFARFSEDEFFARAVENNFPGVRAHYTSGCDHINSDDVKEDWHSVTITWKTT